MTSSYSPWDRLTVCQQTVLANWQNFPNELLVPTGAFATNIPCPHPKRSTQCVLRVLEHDENDSDVEAINNSDCLLCDIVPVSREQLIVYRVDYHRLLTHCANALHIKQNIHPVTSHHQLWQIGSITPQRHNTLPVYACLADQNHTNQALQHLSLDQSEPFVFIVANNNLINHANLHISKRYRLCVIDLNQLLTIDTHHATQTMPTGLQCIQEWLTTVLPAPDKPSAQDRFPTPMGIQWEDIIITFITRDVITIKCGQSAAVSWERLHIPDMAVRSSREKKPSDQWFLLMALAMTQGKLSIKAAETVFGHTNWERIRKQKSLLSRAFQHFFGLASDPIVLDRRHKYYRTRFTIVQDSNCDLSDWIKDMHR